VVNPILVVGGGLAGGAVATRLARAGRAVTVLEREPGPHEKVCGEFLSVEACRDLERLGLAPETLGGLPIDRIRVHHRHRTVEAPLPFLARSLGRATLDEALLQTAARAGAEVVRGTRVTRIEGGTVFASDGERTSARILLATGKHDVRGLPRSARSTRHGYVGFKMHWRLPAPALARLGSAIELHLSDHGYAGLQRVGARDANLCLVVKRAHLDTLGGSWDALLAELLREPVLAARLGDAEALFTKPLAIANLPYGFVYAPDRHAAGNPWRLGDQAAMTASLTGDGMAGALRSAHLAADCIERDADGAQYHQLLGQQVGRQVRRAMLLQRLTENGVALQAGMIAARLWPGLLGHGARATRLPQVSI
jgi:flavin-dependent dehydrogenase